MIAQDKVMAMVAQVHAGGEGSATRMSVQTTLVEERRSMPLLTADPEDCDKTIARCKRWVGWQIEINALQREWARIEHQLSQANPDFFRLNVRDRRRLAGGGERMAVIDARIELLYKLLNRELPRLPKLKAHSLEAILAKLAVVRELAFPDESPEIHMIVSDSIADLTRLLPKTGPG